MRPLLVLITVLLVAGCGLLKHGFRGKGKGADPFPVVPYEAVQSRAGGLHPPDHVALAKWDDEYYYFEWRKIVEPATMKTENGSGKVPVREFDAKNGQPLERGIGIVGKEDHNGQLYNAGVD